MNIFAEINSYDNMVKVKFVEDCIPDTVENETTVKINTLSEFLSLYNSTVNWYRRGADDVIYAPYIGDLKIAFDRILIMHQNTISSVVEDVEVDITKSYRTGVDGESKLVYQPFLGKMFLAHRDKNINSQYCICIPNNMREEYIADCKKLGKKKYVLLREEEPRCFKKWANIIKSEYRRQYLEERVSDV